MNPRNALIGQAQVMCPPLGGVEGSLQRDGGGLLTEEQGRDADHTKTHLPLTEYLPVRSWGKHLEEMGAQRG